MCNLHERWLLSFQNEDNWRNKVCKTLEQWLKEILIAITLNSSIGDWNKHLPLLFKLGNTIGYGLHLAEYKDLIVSTLCKTHRVIHSGQPGICKYIGKCQQFAS